MRIIFTVLLSLYFFFAQAQQPTSYYYTPTSERYFSDSDMDSIFHHAALDVFTENDIPADLFEKKYPKVKPVLFAFSRTAILQSFKWVESTGGTTLKAAKGSAAYNKNKELYNKELIKDIRKTFDNNILKIYLSVNGSDRITSFKSIVWVGADGKLTVQEIIRIYNGDGMNTGVYGNDEDDLEASGAMNNEIKRGIVRAFPLYYINKENHLFQNTTFNVKKVLRDGVKEEYHTESKDNGILLFTGNKNIFLPKGNYTYSITYETEHQLKLLKDYDELYWNVTGNGWSFKIDSASCTVVLPASFAPISSKGYTGAQDEAKEDYTMSRQTVGDSVYITFKTTRALLPNHGLTIATSWAKGFVQAPSKMNMAWYYFWSNKAVFFMPFVGDILFHFLFYFLGKIRH